MKKISIFTKFTALIVATAFLIAVVTHVALFVNFSNLRNNTPIQESFHRLANLIVTQINGEDTVEARHLVDRYGFDLRYVRDDFEWASSPDMPTVVDAVEKSNGKLSYWQHKGLVSIVEKGDATYVFRGISPFEQLKFPWTIFLLWLGMLTIIFGVTHFTIGRLLRPVRILQHGVKQVSAGKFDIQLSRTTSDELGELVQSFNNMALQIRNDMKSRDQLLCDISHELRSPLARMLLALEFVPEGNIRRTFKRNIAILEKMTAGILEDERLNSPFGKIKRIRIDCTLLVGEIVESKKMGAVSVKFDNHGACMADVDEERMRMALSNIIENAINYSRPESKDNAVAVACLQGDNCIAITVKDNGIGIPALEMPFIFEPFYRVDKARRHRSGGFGLGLHLTKKIIEAHGGTITVESSPEAGTTVAIQLPIAKPQMP